jgi:hypothetical protein
MWKSNIPAPEYRMEKARRMNENRTTSILQRLPVILAVTAASYGLALPVGARTAAQQQVKTQQSQPATQR